MDRLTEQGRKKYAELRRLVVSRARTIPAPFDSAARCLENARKWEEKPDRETLYGGESVWAGRGGSDGATFSAYGESRVRWFGNPESKGLRFVGLAHDVGKAGYTHLRNAVEHTGWWLDPDGCGETVSGVVYQLPGRDGRARYMAGYADPWNCDKAGRGPALLSLDLIEGDPTDSDYDPDPVLREAARRADGIAERMAEAERDYQGAYRAGREARKAASEALSAGRAMVTQCRALRTFWRARAGTPMLPGPMARAAIRAGIAELRTLRESYLEARDVARSKLDDKPRALTWVANLPNPAFDAWREGYAEGAF